MFEGLLQPTHLILILVIVLIVFGPGKLPEVGNAVGRSLREFKRASGDPSEADRVHQSSRADVQTAAPMVTCSSCHAESAPVNKFCGGCGAPLS